MLSALSQSASLGPSKGLTIALSKGRIFEETLPLFSSAGIEPAEDPGGSGIYEPLDLGIARCKLMVAGFEHTNLQSTRRLRIATKYVRCTQAHFANRLRQVEIIKLYGSMELAPLAGLADLIVDVVDSGATLKANGLTPLEHIADISSRLIVNRGSMKLKHAQIQPLVKKLAEAVAKNPPEGL